MRKNSIFFLSLLLALVTSFTMVSCDKEDEDVNDPTEGLLVGDGMYITQTDVDPVGAQLLGIETVEDAGFTSQDRTGFTGGWIYLEAGNYNIVEVTNKEITLTLGGSAEKITDEASSCDLNDYYVVNTTEGGAGFSVGTAGLYRVTFDEMTGEVVYHQIMNAGLIGDATPNGWSNDTPIEGSVNAEGGSWSAEGVVLRQGAWKVRFNCRWIIDRRTTQENFDPENGYQIFTNFGGNSPADLLNGNDGGNIPQTEEGTYTVTLDWTPKDGFALTVTRTGDAPEVTFSPNDYNWGVIGDATANGWDSDRNLYYRGEDNGVHSWFGVVTLADGGNFKFRANDAWDVNLGGTLAADGVASTLDVGGSDIPSPGAGGYYFQVSTADEGDSWQATMSEFGWSVIGSGSPSAGWDTDTDLTADGFVDGVETFSLTGDFTTDIWKFRAGHDWKLNLGGNLSTLVIDGSDLSLSEAGTYKIVLSFDGADFSATADKQ